MHLNHQYFIAILLLCFPLSQADDPLSSPTGYLHADIKKGASLDPSYEATGYWNGSVYGVGENDKLTKLFRFEGFNIRSVSPHPEEDGVFISLSREVSVYRSLESGDILVAWTNVYTGVDNEVFAVANDPVNAILQPGVGVYQYSPSHTSFTGNIFLKYPNPLPPVDYSNYSAGEMYVGAELFQTFANTEQLLDQTRTEVPYFGDWVRVGQWLPWMARGASPRGLFYNAPFFKLNSVEDLRGQTDLYEWTVENHPEYLKPPRNYTKPNVTSWRFFKQIVDTRREKGQPDIQVPEQPPPSPSKDPSLDSAVLDDLVQQGRMMLGWNGTLNVIQDEEAGEEMLWGEGVAVMELAKGDNGTWVVSWDVGGTYSTPWPEKTPVSGLPWVNPEGEMVSEVPFVEDNGKMVLGLDNCSSMEVIGQPWTVVSLEVLGGKENGFVSLYVGQESRDVIGSLTGRMEFPGWSGMQGPGYILSRWIFYSLEIEEADDRIVQLFCQFLPQYVDQEMCFGR